MELEKNRTMCVHMVPVDVLENIIKPNFHKFFKPFCHIISLLFLRGYNVYHFRTIIRRYCFLLMEEI